MSRKKNTPPPALDQSGAGVVLAPDVIRPYLLEQVYGIQEIKNGVMWHAANGWPRALLLCGPSGCGKTTIARIIRDMVRGVYGGAESDRAESARQCIELGCTEIEDATAVIRHHCFNAFLHSHTLDRRRAVVILNEVDTLHAQAQQALCSTLERGDLHGGGPMFVCTTTRIGKVDTQIQGRCTIWHFAPLEDEDAHALAAVVADSLGLPPAPAGADLPTTGRNVVQAVLASPTMGWDTTKHVKVVQVLTGLLGRGPESFAVAYGALRGVDVREMLPKWLRSGQVPAVLRHRLALVQGEVFSAVDANARVAAEVVK